MRIRIVITLLLLPLFLGSLIASETTPHKKAELLKLIYYSEQLKHLKGIVDDIINSLRKTQSQVPESYLTSLATEVSTNDYAQWCFGFFDAELSYEDLVSLNVIFSDPAKKAVLEDIAQLRSEKSGKEFIAAVEELRRMHPTGEVDEIIAFVQAKPFERYRAVLGEIKADEKEEVVKLFMEAQNRLHGR